MEEVDELLDKLKECPAEQLELVVYAAVIEKLKITAEKYLTVTLQKKRIHLSKIFN